MILRLVSQLVLATSLLQVFPHDISAIEQIAGLPEAGARQVLSVDQMFSLMNQPLPEAGDALREPVKIQPESVGVITSAASAMIIDRATGKVLFEKNIDEARSIGSITKLMTALIFLETNPDLDAPAMLLAEDLRYGGIQHMGFNDEVRIRDLLLTSLVGSDNSATAALVRLSGLSLEEFVLRMNERASDFGLAQTTFVDSTGLSAENRSIAPDIVKLIDETMNVEFIQEATQLESYGFRGASGRYYSILSTNELLGSYLNQGEYTVLGGKTGFLPAAGYCFGVIVSEDNAHEIIVVVLGSYTKEGRFQDAKALAAWAYKVYQWPDELALNDL